MAALDLVCVIVGVRKYHLNPVGEPGKYSSLSEDSGGSYLTSLQARSRPSTPGGASSLRTLDEPFRETGRGGGELVSGSETFPLPHLFKLHVDDDFVKNYSDSGDKTMDYKYSQETPQTSMAVDSQPVPPPLPPRNLKPGMVLGKPDSYYDPNPRPHQKEYSPEDIHQMLRPMNQTNTVLQEPTQHAHGHEALSSPSYHTLHHPPGYTPSCTCEHSRIHRPAIDWQKSMIPQGAYSYRQENLQPHYRAQTIHNPQQHRYSLPYDRVRPSFHPSPVRSVQPDVRYNTISLDTVMRPEFRQSYAADKPRLPAETSGYHPQDVVASSVQQNAISRAHGASAKDASREAATNHDRFHQSGVLNQQPFNDNEFDRHCHTIPEEVSWPPPFQYDPALRHVHPTGFRY